MKRINTITLILIILMFILLSAAAYAREPVIEEATVDGEVVIIQPYEGDRPSGEVTERPDPDDGDLVILPYDPDHDTGETTDNWERVRNEFDPAGETIGIIDPAGLIIGIDGGDMNTWHEIIDWYALLYWLGLVY